MSLERQPFAVIAKPVGSRCNMRCAYCYYLEKGQYSQHERQTRMSYPLLEKLIRQTIEANPGPVISFTWHGGEPTLAGLEFFQKVVELERKYLPRGWQVWNSLQTNGLLLNDAWCRFLKEHRFDVGLSVDGDALTHDKNRRDRGGAPTWDRVRRAALRLKAHGILPDLLCTVTADTVRDPLAVYAALRELGTGWIQFIPVVIPLAEGGFHPLSVAPEDYGRFLCTVFDQWVTHDLGRLDVQLFAETARVWAGGEPGLCALCSTCGRVLVAEEDGSIYACDHFVDDRHRLGSLLTHRLETLANSPEQRAFGESKRTSLTETCRSCPWLSACGGGCLKDRYDAGQYYLCPGLEAFFAHAHPVLTQVMAMSKQGKTPAEIMRHLS